MKNGIFIILNENGRLIAAIRRADNGIVKFEDLQVSDTIQALDGKPCQYLPKGAQIIIDGKNIYQMKYVPKVEVKKEVTKSNIDWRSQINKASNIIDDTNDENMEVTERPKIKTDSFLITKSQVPSDVRQAMSNFKDIDNFYLKLNKFARFDSNEKGEQKFFFFNAQERKDLQKRVVLGKFEIKENFGNNDIFNKLKNRNLSSAKSLFPNGKLIEQSFKPNYRLVVGLGGHSVYETSMTLHHIYGIPYISASSIKGVVRSWIIFNQFNNDENRALGNETFCSWFGSQKQSGKLVFFDAFPTETPRIEPDIMNVHYPKYYQGTEAPTDTQSPNPVMFLTVTKSPFLFLVGAYDLDFKNSKIDGKNIQEWLKLALTQHGIGAKTAIGYGYFKEQ